MIKYHFYDPLASSTNLRWIRELKSEDFRVEDPKVWLDSASLKTQLRWLTYTSI